VKIPIVGLNTESIVSFSHNAFQTGEGVIGTIILVTVSWYQSKQFAAIICVLLSWKCIETIWLGLCPGPHWGSLWLSQTP